MLKNVAGQKIGCQMTTAADGTDFTGAVTVYVTGDAGTQAAGSVGSGACTHEGNGYHTYAPAQAETNHDLVAFTFKGTGAITVTVQVPTLPEAGATAAALATVAGYIDTEVAAIKAKTDNLPASPAAVGSAMTLSGDFSATMKTSLNAATPTSVQNIPVDGSLQVTPTTASKTGYALTTAPPTAAEIKTAIEAVGSTLATLLSRLVGTIASGTHTAQSGDSYAKVNDATIGLSNLKALIDAIDGIVDAVKLKTDGLPTDPADQSLLAAAIAGIGALDAAGVRAAIGLAAANLDDQIAALPTASENADGLLGRNLAGGSDGGRMVKDALRLNRNKVVVDPVGKTITVYAENDSTVAWTGTLTSSADAEPITGIDPA
jgi:hypothetical protein